MTVKQLIQALGRADPSKSVKVGGVSVTAMTENDECVSLILPSGVSITGDVPPPETVAPPVAEGLHESPVYQPPVIEAAEPPVPGVEKLAGGGLPAGPVDHMM